MATVNEMIEILQQIAAEGHGELDLMASYNYGDHWRTQVAIGLSGATVESVQHSDYHSMYKVVDVDEEEEYSEDGTRIEDPTIHNVIMLS
jgi:hypothetical protein